MRQKIQKKDSKQRIVWAEVYAPDIPDTDGEFMSEEGIREMAYKFMKEGRQTQIDSGHSNVLLEGACVVESFIARPEDPVFIEKSWVVGVHLPADKDWEKVEKGEWNGFSMEAFVQKDQVEVEIELPPVITGHTLKSDEDGHEHTFYVSYDDRGRFLGGRTDEVNGHHHVIRKGVVTEVSEGHTHRFSHLDEITVKV